jgi:hypothetical protein
MVTVLVVSSGLTLPWDNTRLCGVMRGDTMRAPRGTWDDAMEAHRVSDVEYLCKVAQVSQRIGGDTSGFKGVSGGEAVFKVSLVK